MLFPQIDKKKKYSKEILKKCIDSYTGFYDKHLSNMYQNEYLTYSTIDNRNIN